MLGKFAFWMAGSRVGAWIVGFVFAHLSGLLPVREVTAHAHLKIFHHPKPIDDMHILIVPKRAVRSALWLADKPFAPTLWADIESTFPTLGTGHRIFFNGGNRQDVAQLHVHVTSPAVWINGWQSDQHLVLSVHCGQPLADQLAHAITHYGARLKAAKGFTFAFGDEKEGLYLSASTACLHLILDEH